MLDINEFARMLKNEVERRMGERYYIEMTEVVKNNSCKVTGLTIRDSESAVINKMAPTFYAEEYYGSYEDGADIGDIANTIIKGFYNVEYPDLKIDQLYNKDELQKNVFYRLINTAKNTETLENCPHIEFNDLSLVFYYLCDKKYDNIKCFMISNNFMNHICEVTIDDLYSMAHNNMPLMFPEKLEELWRPLYRSSIRSGSPMDNSELEMLSSQEMYIYSNEEGLNGASVILYGSKISELAKRLNSDIYIIPSSVHEVILMPAYDYYDPESLIDLVQDVNSVAVDAKDFLADNVYIYSHETGIIKSCFENCS